MTSIKLFTRSLVGFAILISSAASAYGVQNIVVVTSIQVNKSYGGGIVVFDVAGLPSSGKPACGAGNPNSWLLKSTDGNILNNSIYSALIVSFTTGKSVSLAGTGTCSVVPFVEDVDVVQLVP